MRRSIVRSLVLFAFMASFMLLIMAVASAAGYYTYGDYKLYLDYNNKLTINEYNGYASNLTIPSSIQGYPVVAIDGFSFRDCATLTNVTIPSSVKTIGSYAFDGCSSLTTVVLPAGLTTIASSSFGECISLKNINIPSTVSSLGGWAFYKCTSLSSIQLPAGLNSIGDYAFSYCSSLSNIGIPNGVTSIGGSAFSYCGSLTSIAIPNSVVSIGNFGFAYCDSLSSVTLSNKMTTISSSLFTSNSSLHSITLPASIKTIASNAFSFIDHLTIGIPASVTSISGDSFVFCDDLTIVGFFGSYAQTYANDHNIYFDGVYPLPEITSFTVDKTLIPVGETVNCSISATGGKPPLLYGIDIYEGAAMIYEGPWQDTTSFSYTFTETGTYTIVGYVSDDTDEQDQMDANIVVYTPLELTSVTADKVSSETGKPITWTLAASNGSGTKSYLFKLYKDGVQLSAGSYSSSKTYSYTPSAAGTYRVVGYVKDSTGTKSMQSSDVLVYAPLTITSVKANKTSADTGTPITWTLAATGGQGTKTYLFKLYKGTQLLYSGSYADAKTYSYTPTAAGTYSVVGYVKDSTGTKSLKSADIVVKVPLTITSVKADKTTAEYGSAITWKTTATGGSGTKTYLFNLYKDGKLLATRNYSTANTYSFTNKAAGAYSVVGFVKDSTGTKSLKSAAVIVAPLSIASINADKPGSVIGSAITWTATAAGGGGTKTYKFKLYKGSELIFTGKYGTSRVFKYTPAKDGTYSVLVYVKDKSGTASKKSSGIIVAPLSITSVTADKTNTVTGSAITWAATAAGGNGVKTYLFKVYKNNVLISTGTYGSTNTFKYTPTAAGTYSAEVFVKDSSRTLSKKGGNVIVFAPLSITSLNAGTSNTVIGSAITWTMTAANGSGAKSYRFDLYKGSDLISTGSYGAANTYTYTPAEAGTYSVVGFVKDSSGSVSVKGADVIVYARVSIASVTADKTSAQVGTAITWTLAAAGGSGEKSYRFELYKGGDLIFSGSYGTTNTYSYTPTEAGIYSVLGFVQDSSGTTSMMSANVIVYAPLSIVSVTADKASEHVGTAITWTTTVANGSGAKSYRFELFKDGAVLDSGSYGAAETYTYAPIEVGTYSVKCYAQDSSGTVWMISADVIVYTRVSIVSVIADKTSAQVGTAITWTLATQNGIGEKSYRFELCKYGEVLNSGSYGAAETYTYTPSEEGSYSVVGYVQDDSGIDAVMSANIIAYVPLSITEVTDDTTDGEVDVGTKVAWTLVATGGYGMKSYRFDLYKDGEMLEEGTYSDTNIFEYTPAEAGAFRVKGFVKDSTGTESMMSEDVIVIAP